MYLFYFIFCFPDFLSVILDGNKIIILILILILFSLSMSKAYFNKLTISILNHKIHKSVDLLRFVQKEIRRDALLRLLYQYLFVKIVLLFLIAV